MSKVFKKVMAAYNVQKMIHKEDFDGHELIEHLLSEGHTLEEISDFIENDFAQVLEEGLIRKVDKAFGSPLQKRRIDKKNMASPNYKENRSTSEIERKSENTKHNLLGNKHLTGGWHARDVRNKIKGAKEREKQLSGRRIALKDLHKHGDNYGKFYREDVDLKEAKRMSASDPRELSDRYLHHVEYDFNHTRKTDKHKKAMDIILKHVDKEHGKKSAQALKLLGKNSLGTPEGGFRGDLHQGLEDSVVRHSKKKMKDYVSKNAKGKIQESKGYGGGTPKANATLDKILDRIQKEFGPGSSMDPKNHDKEVIARRQKDPKFQKWLKDRGKK